MALPKKTLPIPVDLKHLTYDSTERVEYLKREGTLRGTELYLSAGLVADMEEEWQTNLLAVKTITDRKTFQVYVFNADPAEDEEEVVTVRKSETLSSATISFYIPLQILNLKLAKGRQVKLEPTLVDAGDKGLGYCFDLRSIRAKKSKSPPANSNTGGNASNTGGSNGESANKQ